jgi:hypothetical protein
MSGRIFQTVSGETVWKFRMAPIRHFHESTRSAKTPVLPPRIGEKYAPDLTLTIFQTVSEDEFSEVQAANR